MPPEIIDSLEHHSLKLLIGSLLSKIDGLEAKLGTPPKTPDNSSLPPPIK